MSLVGGNSRRSTRPFLFFFAVLRIGRAPPDWSPAGLLSATNAPAEARLAKNPEVSRPRLKALRPFLAFDIPDFDFQAPSHV